MNIDVYNMNEEYVCSGTAELEKSADFEELCNTVIENGIRETLIEYDPKFAEIVDEVRVDWGYSGYKVFIFGVHLTEEQVKDILNTIDDVNSIGFCELFWEKVAEKRTYTGVVLAYDAKHFHRIRQEGYSFVAFTYKNISYFLDLFSVRYTFENPQIAKILTQIQFRHDKIRERESLKQKMRGVLVMPKVDMNRKKMLSRDYTLTGKMHSSSLNGEGKFNNFDNYWAKKNERD